MLKKHLRCKIIRNNLRIKKFLLLIILIGSACCDAQISNGIFGQNADLTNTIGEASPQPSGLLDTYWVTPTNYISDSKTKFMRYGGNLVEANCQIDGTVGAGDDIDKTIADYIAKAEKMQDDGITPMMTLPLKLVGNVTTVAIAATHAGSLVTGVNTQLKTDGYNAVVYWIYSNEPDNESGPHAYDGTDGASKIHDYIVLYNTAVTAIWNGTWGTLTFVGPELYSFDNYTHTGGLTRLMEQLTGNYNQLGGAANAFDITPYISFFTWHYYPFTDESTVDTYVPDPTTSNVIGRLTANTTTNIVYDHDGITKTNSLKKDINDLQGWISTSGNSAVKLAITEANICYKNDILATRTNDLPTGNGTNSFIAGQFWTEMMGICMEQGVQVLNFWSSIGGQSGDSYKTNSGFLNSDPGKFGGLIGGKKPTYYHYQMLANNFAGGTFLGNTYTNSNVAYKGFAYTNGTTLGIVIMNQDNADHTFEAFFNGDTPSGSDIMFSYSVTATEHAQCTIKANSTMFMKYVSGAFVSSESYSLNDAFRGASDVGFNISGGATTDELIVSNSNYSSYAANNNTVYRNISITPTSSISAPTNNVFLFTGTATITGSTGNTFSSNGHTLCISHTDDVTCP